MDFGLIAFVISVFWIAFFCGWEIRKNYDLTPDKPIIKKYKWFWDTIK